MAGELNKPAQANKKKVPQTKFQSAAVWLQPSQMKTAIDVNNLAGAKRQEVLDDSGNGLADIPRRAPTFDRSQPFGNQAIVFFFHGGSHIGGDDSGANLINIDAIFGQTSGEERREHGKGGLGDAIIAA